MGLSTPWIGVTTVPFYDSDEWVVGDSFGQPLTAQTDTVSDALDGLNGSAIGAIVLAAWAAAELPTRRVPEGRRGPGAGRAPTRRGFRSSAPSRARQDRSGGSHQRA